MINLITCKLARNAALKGTLYLMKHSAIKRALDYEDRHSTRDDESVLHLAAKSGHISQIPESLLTLNVLTKKDRHGNNVFHIAARHHCIEMLPETSMTINNLLLMDNRDNTAFHIAAECRCINQIPSSCLTQQTVTVRNRNLFTPLHNAATFGCLDHFPSHLLTYENLILEDKGKDTVVFTAARCEYIMQIPPGVFRGKRKFIEVELDKARRYLLFAGTCGPEAKQRIITCMNKWFLQVE